MKNLPEIPRLDSAEFTVLWAMPKVSRLGHFGLRVKDLQRALLFYRDILGLQVTAESEAEKCLFLSSRPDEEHHEILISERLTPTPSIFTIRGETTSRSIGPLGWMSKARSASPLIYPDPKKKSSTRIWSKPDPGLPADPRGNLGSPQTIHETDLYYSTPVRPVTPATWRVV